LDSADAMGKYRTAVNLVATLQQFLALLPTLIFPRLIEWHKQGPTFLWTRQVQTAAVLAGLGTCLTIGAFIFAPILYPILYGPAFASAAIPFALLVASKSLVLVEGVFSWGLLAQKKDKLVLTIMVATAAIAVPSYFFIIPRFGMLGAAAANLFSQSVFFTACIMMSYFVSKRAKTKYQ